jgi:hypothetical protein
MSGSAMRIFSGYRDIESPVRGVKLGIHAGPDSICRHYFIPVRKNMMLKKTATEILIQNHLVLQTGGASIKSNQHEWSSSVPSSHSIQVSVTAASEEAPGIVNKFNGITVGIIAFAER